MLFAFLLFCTGGRGPCDLTASGGSETGPWARPSGAPPAHRLRARWGTVGAAPQVVHSCPLCRFYFAINVLLVIPHVYF